MESLQCLTKRSRRCKMRLLANIKSHQLRSVRLGSKKCSCLNKNNLRAVRWIPCQKSKVKIWCKHTETNRRIKVLLWVSKSLMVCLETGFKCRAEDFNRKGLVLVLIPWSKEEESEVTNQRTPIVWTMRSTLTLMLVTPLSKIKLQMIQWWITSKRIGHKSYEMAVELSSVRKDWNLIMRTYKYSKIRSAKIAQNQIHMRLQLIQKLLHPGKKNVIRSKRENSREFSKTPIII